MKFHGNSRCPLNENSLLGSKHWRKPVTQAIFPLPVGRQTSSVILLSKWKTDWIFDEDFPNLNSIADLLLVRAGFTHLLINLRLMTDMYYATTGVKAVKWIMHEKSCTESQATAIANKLLNAGFLSHVSHEHLFCPKNLLYRFSVEIDPLAAGRYAFKWFTWLFLL